MNTLSSRLASGALLPALMEAHSALGARLSACFDALRNFRLTAERGSTVQRRPDNASPPPGTASLKTLRCAETGRHHDVLPLERNQEITKYLMATRVAADPVGGRFFAELCNLQDAFGPVSLGSSKTENSVQKEVLVPETFPFPVVESTQGGFKTLFCPDTGLSASITYDAQTKELLVSFGGLGSQGGDGWGQRLSRGLTQGLQAAVNILGFGPPTIFKQASDLTEQMKQHLVEVNKERVGDPIKLRLGGHSMGGGMATYAALKNDVPAIVTAPMRLGLGTRCHLGEEMLLKAAQDHGDTGRPLVTEVVGEGDWVANNSGARMYSFFLDTRDPVRNPHGAIGKRYLVPTPSREGIEGAGYSRTTARNFAMHNDLSIALKVLAERQQPAPTP